MDFNKQVPGSTSSIDDVAFESSSSPVMNSPGSQGNVSSTTTSNMQMSAACLKREQKRRPKPKDGQDMFCSVCGDKALGYNFDAVTCESCKAFFRRNALKDRFRGCSFDGNCKLDPHTRKFCSGCRLKKCLDMGMKKEWILSNDQLQKRRRKSDPQPDQGFHCSASDLSDVDIAHKEEFSPSTCASSGSLSCKSPFSDTDSVHSQEFHSPIKCEPESNDDYVIPLTSDIYAAIHLLQASYDTIFNAPYSCQQAEKFTSNPRSSNELYNMTDMFIRRLIKFAKGIKEFFELKQEDQIALLKGGVMEILVLRSAMGFSSEKHGWQYKTHTGADSVLDEKVIAVQGRSMYNNHVMFVMSLHDLTRKDKTILLLLFLIELFSSDRVGLNDKDSVCRVQEKYSTWLKLYLESTRPLAEARSVYPKLLLKLTDVRELGESSAQIASQLDISQMEPLLVEVFNLLS